MTKEHIVVGLDIGTTKICAVVGEILSDRSVNVIGIGSHRSTGLRKGMVVNMDSTVTERSDNFSTCGRRKSSGLPDCHGHDWWTICGAVGE